LLILSELKANFQISQKCNITKLFKNISEVGEYSSDSNILLKTFENIIGQFRLTQVNKWLNKAKNKGNKLKAFWVKTKGSETWKMLVSTDTDITFTNAMKYYQIRWSIEVFFKESKQNLNINKCQSTDFDAHIAWITLSFISYMMLSLRKRFDDYETLGEVFRAFKNELLEITLVEKPWQIIEILYLEILAELGVDWEIFLNKLA
jgi:hypothetical protein